MKIQSVPMQSAKSKTSPKAAESAVEANPEFVMFEVSGPLDLKNDVLIRARQLVVETGSTTMIESFDGALKHGTLFGTTAKD